METLEVSTSSRRRGARIVGVLNVTPDSFSDGGRFTTVERAEQHALQLVACGAHIIDVGGESTRPGASTVSAEEELRRVRHVIERLVRRGIRVSVDTRRSEVALAALAEGAEFINDVSGGLCDPRMLGVVAESNATFIASHWAGGADSPPPPGSILASVVDDLGQRLESCREAGLERVILDPGLGFGKSAPQNWEIIGGLGELRSLGAPILLGHSRKRFLGATLGDLDSPASRDVMTAAISLIGAEAGVWGLRVHQVEYTRDVLRSLVSH
ncbi:dihydropteroate synthase [Agromyces sp. Soil535]|uniref:dihydropteroate synthase n=1 Tax=Agromyces sp. Soil535 TaxID=1736390 RepID=UPI0006FE9C14|nr:dihydropteroate synthase [Agromyces sp. Soil535]KRE23313.1 hypothetical protein ASG80_06195 [Agromyces sp. Soil535]